MLESAHEWIAGLPPFAEQPATYLLCAIAAVVAALALKSQLYAWKQDWCMRSLPKAPGGIPFFGHALSLLSATPWDMMEEWARDNNGKLVRMQVRYCAHWDSLSPYGRPVVCLDPLTLPHPNVAQVMQSRGIIVSKPVHLNHVLNKRQSNYVKDIEMSYKPFLDILGTRAS